MRPQNKNQNKDQNRTHKNQAGNALFIVLIGVVLFSALMFTFSRGAQQGGSNISSKQADLAASEILDYAARYERAINRLLSRSCSESELNFNNDIITTYDNPSAPAENRCDVFHPNGAAMIFNTLPGQWLESSFSAMTGYGVPVFSGDARMLEIGNDDAGDQDLILWVGFVSRAVCESINKKLGLAAMPTFVAGPFASRHYRGTFTDTWQGELSVPGLMTACAMEPGGTNAFPNDSNTAVTGQAIDGSHHFYQILIAR